MEVATGAGSLVLLPVLHASLGSAITTAAVNIGIVIGVGWITTWFVADSEESDEKGADEGRRGPAWETFSPLRAYVDDTNCESVVNIGILGAPGSGKSSLVNALLSARPGSVGAAKVGAAERTTTRPAQYDLRVEEGGDCSEGDKGAGPKAGERSPETTCTADGELREMRTCLWDLPAVGTARHPNGVGVDKMGVECLDMVWIVYSQRITDVEVELAHKLEDALKVPHIFVRSQVDLDIENEAEDHALGEEEVLQKLRSEAAAVGFATTYMVSSRHPDKYDFHQLWATVLAVVKGKLRAKSNADCPICFEKFSSHIDACLPKAVCQWCGNAVCERCARKLRGKMGEALCPFCRRWTPLACAPKP